MRRILKKQNTVIKLIMAVLKYPYKSDLNDRSKLAKLNNQENNFMFK